MGGKGGGGKAKPKFKSYAEARKDREKFRKKLVRKLLLWIIQGVSKKTLFKRLAPLEAPRLFIGLEIIPKCYKILFVGRAYTFTHFHNIYGWFPPKYGPKYGPLKQNKVHG